jgi:hypothetical protein
MKHVVPTPLSGIRVGKRKNVTRKKERKIIYLVTQNVTFKALKLITYYKIVTPKR